MKPRVILASLVLAFTACDRADESRNQLTRPTPEHVSIDGIRMGMARDQVLANYPGFDCPSAPECELPSPHGSLRVQFVDGRVAGATLIAEGSLHLESLDDVLSDSLYAQIVRSVGAPTGGYDNRDLLGRMWIWTASDGSELVLKGDAGAPMVLSPLTLRLGNAGTGKEWLQSIHDTLDQRLSELIKVAADGGVEIAGIRLGAPLPVALGDQCLDFGDCRIRLIDSALKGRSPFSGLVVKRAKSGAVLEVVASGVMVGADEYLISESIARLNVLQAASEGKKDAWTSPRGDLLQVGTFSDALWSVDLRLSHATPARGGFGG